MGQCCCPPFSLPPLPALGLHEDHSIAADILHGRGEEADHLSHQSLGILMLCIGPAISVKCMVKVGSEGIMNVNLLVSPRGAAHEAHPWGMNDPMPSTPFPAG